MSRVLSLLPFLFFVLQLPQPTIVPGRVVGSAGQTAVFATLSVGTPVVVKDASALQAIFSSPSSQWSRELGPRVQNNTQPRAQHASQAGVVVQVDNSDSTVEVQVGQAKAWFTPGCPMCVLCMLGVCSRRCFC